MSDLLSSVSKEALGQYGERITCVEAHLTDAKAAINGGLNDIHCMLEARPVGFEPVVVTDRAGTAHQAMQRALRKLQPAIASAFEKHDLSHTLPAVNRRALWPVEHHQRQ